MKKLLLVTTFLTVFSLPAFAETIPCRSMSRYNAAIDQVNAAKLAANAITDICSPAWFTAHERAMSLGRQAVSLYNATLDPKCHLLGNGDSPATTIANWERYAQQNRAVCAARVEKKREEEKKQATTQHDPRNIPTPQRDNSKTVPTPQQAQPKATPAPSAPKVATSNSQDVTVNIPTPGQRSDNRLPPRLGPDGVTVIPQFRDPSGTARDAPSPTERTEDKGRRWWDGDTSKCKDATENDRATAAWYEACVVQGDEGKREADDRRAKYYDKLGIHPEVPIAPGDRIVSNKAEAEKKARLYLDERKKAQDITRTAKGQELLDALEYMEVATRNASIVFFRAGNPDEGQKYEQSAAKLGIMRTVEEADIKKRKLQIEECQNVGDYFSKADWNDPEVQKLVSAARKKCSTILRDSLRKRLEEEKNSSGYDFLKLHPELSWWVE